MSTGLEMHIRATDGSTSSYAQHDADTIQATIRGLDPRTLFDQQYLSIDSRESVIVHPVAEIACIEMVTDIEPGWKYRDDVELRVLKESTFNDAYGPDRDPDMMRPSRWEMGEAFRGFWRLKLRGGWTIHFQISTKVAHSSDQRQAIGTILRSRILFAPREEGGFCFINPANVIRAEAFPGQPEIAPGAWRAEPV